MSSGLSVWAPRATRVEVVVGTERLPLQPEAAGWWRTADGFDAGERDYAFSLDGGPPRPDPRSAFQPHGISRPSRRVEHGRFRWTDVAWRGFDLGHAVIYELHTGTFTPRGTFESAIERLDHVRDLGATAVELMPVAAFSGDRGWGYDGVNLYAPHHAYGGPAGLKALVDACHARGLGVVLDVVYNHLGPAGNHLAEFGPYFTSRYSTPWGEAVNFDDEHSREVRRFFVENARMWFADYHVDALRLDAVHAIVDSSAIHFLEELAGSVRDLERELGRPLHLIAENDLNDPRPLWPRARGGYGLAAAWCDDFHHALHAALTGERAGYYADFGSLEALAKAIRQGFVYDGLYSEYRKRNQGRPPVELHGGQFVVFAQNHDQIGNRAAGERLAALVSPGRLRLAAALVLLAPFVPLLFMGEEWGASTPFQYFTDHRDPDLARAVSEGRRSEFRSFGWEPSRVPDPQDPATFERSKLRWEEIGTPGHRELLEWHRALIRLRRSRPELAGGAVDRVRAATDPAGWLVFENGGVAIAANLGNEPRRVPLPRGVTAVLLSWPEGGTAREGSIELPPGGVAVLG